MNISSRVVAYPAGKCSCILKASDYESVSDWAEQILAEGRVQNIVYLPSAILFFAQQFFSIFSPEFQEIKNHLIERYGDVSYYDEEIRNQQKNMPKFIHNNFVKEEPKIHKMSRKEKKRHQEILKIREKMEQEKIEQQKTENPKKIKLKRR